MPKTNYTIQNLVKVLQLRALDHSFAVIAETMNQPVSTVQYWYKRAKKMEEDMKKWISSAEVLEKEFKKGEL